MTVQDQSGVVGPGLDAVGPSRPIIGVQAMDEAMLEGFFEAHQAGCSGS